MSGNSKESTPEVTITINGMSCGHCVGRVTKALSRVPGVVVRSVVVGRATVTAADAAAINGALAAIEDAGFSSRAASSTSN